MTCAKKLSLFFTMIQRAVISIQVAVVRVLSEEVLVVAPLVSVRSDSSRGPVCLDLSQQKRKRSWEIRCWGTLDLLQVKPLMPNYFLFHFLNLMVEHTHTLETFQFFSQHSSNQTVILADTSQIFSNPSDHTFYLFQESRERRKCFNWSLILDQRGDQLGQRWQYPQGHSGGS